MRPEWERAAREGDAASLAAQLEEAAEIDALDRYGQTALMLAAVFGHDDAVRVLVDAGAELDTTAKYGLSALMLATLNHHESIARRLVAAGADRTLRGTGAPGFAGKTAADFALERGLEALLEDLAQGD